MKNKIGNMSRKTEENLDHKQIKEIYLCQKW